MSHPNETVTKPDDTSADRSNAVPPTIVLVHGAFEDSSIWKGIVAGLTDTGLRAVALDLPGRPSNPMNAHETSIEVYRDAVLDLIRDEPDPVVLVGHSFGGMIISAVAEQHPEKVRTLVYVAALVPRDGDSLTSLSAGSEVGDHLQYLPEEGLASVDYEARAELFANDGTPELKAALPNLMISEPLPPMMEQMVLTARFAGVDKTYVHTTLDHAVSPAAQAAMVAATPMRLSFTLNTGHAPFFTDPEGLIDAIRQVAA